MMSIEDFVPEDWYLRDNYCGCGHRKAAHSNYKRFSSEDDANYWTWNWCTKCSCQEYQYVTA